MNAPTEKLAGDVRVLIADVQELLKAAAAQQGETVAAARVRVQAALAEARETAVTRARHAAQATDRYVHDHPWQSAGVSAGVAAGVALIVGFLLGRR